MVPKTRPDERRLLATGRFSLLRGFHFLRKCDIIRRNIPAGAFCRYAAGDSGDERHVGMRPMVRGSPLAVGEIRRKVLPGKRYIGRTGIP